LIACYLKINAMHLACYHVNELIACYE